MSDDLLFFDFDSSKSSPHPNSNIAIRDTAATFPKPKDNFTAPSPVPGTIFYLTTTSPQANTWTYHGPVSAFASLIPMIEETISPAPSAALKWQDLVRDSEETEQEEEWIDDGWGNFVLREKGPTFKDRGFTTFVFEHELDGFPIPGEYTVLSIIRQVNSEVLSLLPGPLFTVSSHGPLHHDMGTSIKTIHSGRPKGLAATSLIVGSYTTAAAAKIAAHRVMDHMLKDEAGVRRTEDWEDLGTGKGKHVGKKRGVGRGLLLAMDAKKVWEVRVEYESDVLGGAVGRYDGEERNAVEGRKGTWRV